MPSTDSLAADLSATTAAYFAAARREIIDPLPIDRALAILELGCGNGATGALALREGKCGTYVGVEKAGAAAAEARFALTDVYTGDLETLRLPLEPATFDMIICGQALEPLADRKAVLERLVLLLRPGGRLFAAIPAGSALTPKVLRALARRVGLRIDRPASLRRVSGLRRLFGPRGRHPAGPFDLVAHKPWR
jgi:SAM-dependent methyltransferase